MMICPNKIFYSEETARHWETEREKGMTVAIGVARNRAIAEIEGWLTADDEDDNVIKSLVSLLPKTRGALNYKGKLSYVQKKLKLLLTWIAMSSWKLLELESTRRERSTLKLGQLVPSFKLIIVVLPRRW